MKTIPENILNLIDENQSFLILLHQKPDGDAIGSAIALGKGLKQLNKEVDYYIDNPIEERLLFFNEINFFNGQLKEAYDVIIFLDCSTFDFSYRPEILPTRKKTLVIDHHKSNLGYGDINFVEITGATAEIIFRILVTLRVTLDEEMADAVYTGISTDTGSFQFSNVTSDTHQILSELYLIKNNFSPLSKRLHNEKNYNQLKITGEAIHSLELLEAAPIAIMIISYEVLMKYGGSMNISDDVANIGQNIIGNIITALFKEIHPGEYRVSLRSRAPIDIHKVALKYGGGGHERAAGFSFNGNIEEIKEELIKTYTSQVVSNP